VHFVVPDGIDDPERPSGGNVYDRHLSRGLTSVGWSVHEHAAPGFWSHPDPSSLRGLDDLVRRIPDGAAVLLDGLVASRASGVLVAQARRLRLVVLVHMPLGDRAADGDPHVIRTRERAVLWAASAVVTTSAWSRGRLIELYRLPAERVHVAAPGVDPAQLASGTGTGQALLSVAAVTRDKGHDVLIDALATLTDLTWRCRCLGSLGRESEYAEAMRRRTLAEGLGERLRFVGSATGADLDRAYAAADLLVLASRAETYGMVVTEALARGLPVVAADVGGVAEALGQDSSGSRPGLLVPPGDPAALAEALRRWLGDPDLRARLGRSARERRRSLRAWSATVSTVASVLSGLHR
jgi:glycosyltransferase involved in cell wall biosynthesis